MAMRTTNSFLHFYSSSYLVGEVPFWRESVTRCQNVSSTCGITMAKSAVVETNLWGAALDWMYTYSTITMTNIYNREQTALPICHYTLNSNECNQLWEEYATANSSYHANRVANTWTISL